MRYWMYKCNVDGGPAGYWGDWAENVFPYDKPVEWGGDYSTRSPAVSRVLADEVAAGDVIVAYQSNRSAVLGFCVITKLTGPSGDRKIWLRPIERLDPPFKLHRHKAGTILETAPATRSQVMLSELSKAEMNELLALAGAPMRVLKGKPKPGGYRP